VPASLATSIDLALDRITRRGGAVQAEAEAQAHAAAAQPRQPRPVPDRQIRDALHALVGMRLSLFPETLTPGLPPEPEPTA
jgi:hypothetical protein